MSLFPKVALIAALALLPSACSGSQDTTEVAPSPSPPWVPCDKISGEWHDGCYDPFITGEIRKDLVALAQGLNEYHAVWGAHRDAAAALTQSDLSGYAYRDAVKQLEINATMAELDAVPPIVSDFIGLYYELYNDDDEDTPERRLAASLSYVFASSYWTPERWEIFRLQVSDFVVRELYALKAKLLCLRNWRDDDGYIWETGMATDQYGGGSCVDYFAVDQREMPGALSYKDTLEDIYGYLYAIRDSEPSLGIPVVNECFVVDLQADSLWCRGSV